MDIGSGNNYPSSSLSNFAGHRFEIDGVLCYSMEGFLQSLKFKNPEMQKEVCQLVGLKAKYKGKRKKWWVKQTLFWQGEEIYRHSVEYQDLITRAYLCMFNQSSSFRNALKASGQAVLTHSMGKSDASKTVLTRQEFCSRLTELRGRL